MAIVQARGPGCPTILFADGVDSPRDPCAVETVGLANVVERFVDEYGRSPGAGDQYLTGAIQELVKRTQVADPGGLGVSDKTIRSVMKRTYETTDLRTADFLVTAIGCPMVFHDETLRVVENDRAAASVRKTCCGAVPRSSSLTGSL